MFTGVIEEIGTALRCSPTGLVLQAPLIVPGIEPKESLAFDGACLTVIERGEGWVQVDVMPETFRCSRLGLLQNGARVNLERAVPASGRIGGHLVQGHVEATARVLSIEKDGMAHLVEIELPACLRPFVVPKGFLAVNGVSLTVIACRSDRFSLALLPFTECHTNLGEIHLGTLLNLETDIIGRSIVQMAKAIDDDASHSNTRGDGLPLRTSVSTILASLHERRKLPLSLLAWSTRTDVP